MSDTSGKSGAHNLVIGEQSFRIVLGGTGNKVKGRLSKRGGKGNETEDVPGEPPTLGLPPVPTGVVAAFMVAVYRGSESRDRQGHRVRH